MPPPVEIPSDLITPKQAAKLLHCHMVTIYRFCHTGRLRSWWRAGTRFMVSEADCLALFQPVQPRPEIQTTQAIQRQQTREDQERQAAHEAALEQLRVLGVKVGPREPRKPSKKAAS